MNRVPQTSSPFMRKRTAKSVRAVVFFLFFFFVSVLHLSRPQNARACSLPVCDIPAEIKKMESKNEAYRFQFINKLRQDFSKEKNEDKLNNLRDFARQAGELIRKLGDADYILRESKGLHDQSIFLLVQWVWRDCTRLSEGYGELASETQRYSALDFFVRRVETQKDEATIRELVCFARNAEVKSMELGDADYVARQAVLLASTLSNQLLEVIDGWEGVFRILSIEGPLSEEVENLRFVLFSSSGELGIVAALSHPTLNPTVFQKLSFDEHPQFLTSRQSFASATPSTLSLRFSNDYGRIEGAFLEQNEFRKVRFSALRETRVKALSNQPCQEEDLLGSYRANMGELTGQFVITRIGPRQYASIFKTDQSELHLPFAFGRYNPNTGRLTFINLQRNVPLGLRLLAERTSDGRCHVQGWGLSTFTGVTYRIDLGNRFKEN